MLQIADNASEFSEMVVPTHTSSQQARFLHTGALQSLIDLLRRKGYDVIGPTIQQNAIVLRRIDQVEELPAGWTDNQSPAVYQITYTAEQSTADSQDASPPPRRFHFNVGPDSWKRYLFPPTASIGGASLDDDGWHFQQAEFEPPQYAFLGVRACDLAAIAIQDRVFDQGQYVDPMYHQIRQLALIIAVNCSKSSSTCFCSSMGTGPQCTGGFDLVMTELETGYVIEAGSEQGAAILAELPTTLASDDILRQANLQTETTAASITKHFDADGIRETLMGALDHPAWQSVAEKCLSCTNCTMVCPTCFCSSVEEVSDLHETNVQRVRKWDSCFDIAMSRMSSETARPDIRSRYRQWLTHKLATWHDQFGTSGCTGCGRCITWCPVGIDLTESANAIRNT
ncbi:4Fe-4S dicluster domain-containing protein [Stieleria varia]|uniref:Anaerobic sulfite reductase subunit A n=1 Tax=Stieleria varia TaxID=2528005 RepID=A0A5C6AQ02_9BACT|nr:4Fe-4S dicluster domain-containing protein [Stieleria varia]TWU01309.1 Anaerobic sulfite reductase subunit A [Stieleria varia]